MNTIGFLPQKKDPSLQESFIDKWVNIEYQGGGTGGKIVGIEDNCYVLNPYLCKNYSGSVIKYQLMEKKSFVRFDAAANIEITTKANLEGLCKFKNEEFEKNQIKK